MPVKLREYQRAAKEEARRLIAGGCKKLLIVAPTGAGKTVLFTSIVESAVERGSNVLVCAHRRELVRQPWLKSLRAGLDPSKVGVILAGIPAGPAKQILGPLDDADDDMLWSCLARRRPDAPVQIASIDSVRNRAKPPASIVIIDEAHRVLSASYLKLAEDYPNAIFLGFTATPLRCDNKPLGNFFSELVIVSTYRALVAEGFLVEPRVFTVPAVELPDLSRVRLKGSDFDSEQLNQACNQSGLVGSIPEHWIKHGNNAPTFAFGVSVEHSKSIAARFVEAGISALHIDANTPTADRDGALRAVRNGTCKVLCNVDVLTEGVDLTAIKTVVLACPTKSLRKFLQQVGRGSRPDPSGLPFTILDHAGSVLEFGLPQMIEWAPEILHATKPRSAVTSAPARTCPICFACLPAAMPVCPECGTAFAAKPRTEIEEHDGTLIEVTAPTDAQIRQSWDTIVAECLKNGYAPGWCYPRFAELYPGQRPPAGCALPSAEACAAVKNERAEILDSYVSQAVEHGRKIGWARSSFKARTGQWPSADLFAKTATAEALRAVLAGFEALGQAAARWSKERMVTPIALQPEAASIPVAQTLAVVTVSEPRAVVALTAANDLVNYAV